MLQGDHHAAFEGQTAQAAFKVTCGLCATVILPSIISVHSHLQSSASVILSLLSILSLHSFTRSCPGAGNFCFTAASPDGLQ